MSEVPASLDFFVRANNNTVCEEGGNQKETMENEKIYTIEEIKDVLQKSRGYFETEYSVDKFMLFGSYAKNEQTAESDIDLLVSFKHPIDMFDFIDLQDYLIKLFGKKIDLGTVNGLKSFVKDRILKEAIAL